MAAIAALARLDAARLERRNEHNVGASSRSFFAASLGDRRNGSGEERVALEATGSLPLQSLSLIGKAVTDAVAFCTGKQPSARGTGLEAWVALFVGSVAEHVVVDVDVVDVDAAENKPACTPGNNGSDGSDGSIRHSSKAVSKIKGPNGCSSSSIFSTAHLKSHSSSWKP